MPDLTSGSSGKAAPFPDGFLWGAATSAYQIEGSPLADGAGPSIWHRFSHTPGWTQDASTGDVACDHYRRMPEDVALMADLGLRAYRFSIAWGRVLPEGTGAVNRAGLDFYARLVDGLLARGIQPMATLYHWDLPAALDDRGGWLNPDSPSWFAEYARLLFRSLGDRVPLWVTLNEPWVSVDAGYLHGVHAPGHRNLFEAPRAAHHLLRAHAEAVEAFRAEYPQTAEDRPSEGGRPRNTEGPRIGLVVNLEPKDPATDSLEDRAAAERADLYMNRFYLDPVFHGRYPEGLAALFGEAWPDFPESETSAIRQPLDFLGVNYYSRNLVRPDPSVPVTKAAAVPRPTAHRTAMGWEVHPESLTRTLCFVKERYGDIPLYVTENGAAFYDPPSPMEGRIDDPLRTAYLRAHLRAARAAIEKGVDLRGYFAWSLLDNYEWACGYSRRFGIVHVDFDTLERTPKASAEFYREVIRTNGANLT